jgi:hypothetical protein
MCGYGLNIECALKEKYPDVVGPTRLDLVYKNYPKTYNEYVHDKNM